MNNLQVIKKSFFIFIFYFHFLFFTSLYIFHRILQIFEIPLVKKLQKANQNLETVSPTKGLTLDLISSSLKCFTFSD